MNWLTRSITSFGTGWFAASLFTFGVPVGPGMIGFICWLALIFTAGAWYLLGIISMEEAS